MGGADKWEEHRSGRGGADKWEEHRSGRGGADKWEEHRSGRGRGKRNIGMGGTDKWEYRSIQRVGGAYKWRGVAGLHTASGGPGIFPPSRNFIFKIKSSCPSGRHNSIPLIGPQWKSHSQKGYQTVSFCATRSMGEDTHPSHTLTLTMVYQPHGFPAIKKKSPPTKKS